MCGILLRGMKKTWPIFEVGGGGYCVDTYNLCCVGGRGEGVAITWNGP